MSLVHRFLNLFRREKVDAEVEEELQFHFVARLEENLAKGMSPADARCEAARQLGGGLQAHEGARDADLLLWIDTLVRDIRHACRSLWANRAVTAIAVLSLAMGIGANTAIFSAIRAVLLRPLPYKDPERLAMVWMDNRRLGLHNDLTSYPNYLDWKNNRVFEDMAGFVPRNVILTGFEEPARIAAAAVNWNIFSVLGVSPVQGRDFTSNDDESGAARVVMLSYGFWQRQFGGGRQALGASLEINGDRCQVVGVMPASFSFPAKETELWVPLALTARGRANRGGFFLSVIGRWKPGITKEQARAEMTAVGSRLEHLYPNDNRGYGIWVVPLLDQVVGNLKQALWVLSGAVAFVLLIACLNAANLFLGRGAARSREIAVRAALGAGRRRLVRQLLTESAMLSLAAGALGLAMAFASARGMILLAPRDLPRIDQIGIDISVLAFTLGISLLAGFLFGILPAFRISRIDVNESLREGGRGMTGGRRSRLIRSALTVAEVAFSVVLLTGAGLMMHSLVNLLSTRPGFRTENVLTWRIAAPRAKYQNGPEIAAFYATLLERIRVLRGVQSAAAISDIFLSETPNSGSFSVDGHPDPPPEQRIEATTDRVSPNYFQSLGVRLVRGRFFDDHDGPNTTQVVMINETMARRFWPSEDVIGRRFKFGDAASHAPWLTVVGIVRDMRRQGMDKSARCETFQPLAQRPAPNMTLVVPTSSDPAKVTGLVREAIRALEPGAVLFSRSTIADQIGDSLAQRRFETLLLGLFSGLALVLATVGIYGVVYQSVSQRTNEIGVRVALGAQKGGLLQMVVGEALKLVGLGAVFGGIGAFMISGALSSFLYSVTPADPLTYLATIGLMAVAGAAASVLPARRAAAIDPVHALRYQ
jgi:putative ABC transport system permease protein